MNRMYIDNSFNTNKQSSKNFKNIQKILDEHAKWQIRDFSISDIEATVNKKSKFIIYKDSNTNKLIIVSQTIVAYFIDNDTLFNNVYLPEILKIYTSYNNEVGDNGICDNEDISYGYVNNNLYIINYSREFINYNLLYLKSISNKLNYRLELSKNYMDEDGDEVIVSSPKNRRKIYSYGYINILFISFVLSILTIIICLVRK